MLEIDNQILYSSPKLDLTMNLSIENEPIEIKILGELDKMQWKIKITAISKKITVSKTYEFNIYAMSLSFDIGIFGSYIRKEVTAFDIVKEMSLSIDARKVGEIIYCKIQRNGNNWYIDLHEGLKAKIQE